VRSARLAGIAIALAIATPARADETKPIVQRMRFAERGRDLVVSSSISQLFDSAAFGGLTSGLQSIVVIRLWVYDKVSTEPIAYRLIQRRIIYDIEQELFNVQLGAGTKQLKVKERSKAFSLLTSLDAIAIAGLAEIEFEDHYVLALVAELNPVSKETLAEMRRWLTQGTGGGLERGGSFFGSFVSVFVNPKVPEADRVLRMRSQPFFRPTPKKTTP
jgi:hypothetical protein